jgi:hypothetical protein
VTRELPTAAQAIAHAREILAPEDELWEGKTLSQ